jgi:hypothetical protein
MFEEAARQSPGRGHPKSMFEQQYFGIGILDDTERPNEETGLRGSQYEMS